MIAQRRATYQDYLDLLAARGIERPTRHLRCVPVQISMGRAWVWRAPDAPPVALFGIVHAPDVSEMWFVAGPGNERAMPALVRVMRRQLALERQLIGREIVAQVSRHNAPGERLARLCGLTQVAPGIWTTGDANGWGDKVGQQTRWRSPGLGAAEAAASGG